MLRWQGDWRSDLLLRSAQSLAARDEREHQWVTAPILSEGHGPEHAQRRRACRRGGNAEWSSAQDAWMENTCRGFGRAYEIGAHCCCDDRLNSSSIRRWHSANAARKPACGHRWDRSATPTTMRCARASSRPSNASCSNVAALRRRPRRTSPASPLSKAGTTRCDCILPSATARPWPTNRRWRSNQRKRNQPSSPTLHENGATSLGVREQQVAAAISLLDGGGTVPFVARYRKEATGALDDAQLRTLEERLRYL